MRSVHSVRPCCALLIAAELWTIGLAAPAAAETIKAFDPSGSIATYAYAINGKGVVSGAYSDSKHVWHAFVRTAGRDHAVQRFRSDGNNRERDQ